MPSVVIAAHNEQAVIAACLRALTEQRTDDPLEVVVSANGCTDDTAGIAAGFGVMVVDRPEPGKTGALNAGDAAVDGFPRIYMDADIVLPDGAIAELLTALSAPARPLAVAPSRRVDTAGRPLLVRAYNAVNERLPVFQRSLFGRGVIVLSREGRARFGAFPEVIADDLFVDGLFEASEKVVVDSVEVVIAAPFTTRDLVRRLVRVRRGNAQLRAARAAGVVGGRAGARDKWSWLRDVVIPHPWLLPAAVPYVAITVIAGLLARRPQKSPSEWGRDESSRVGRMPEPGRS